MRRMTPAKLLVLMTAQMNFMGLQEMPLASLACLYYNSHRDMGDESKSKPAAPAKSVRDFKVFGKGKKQTLAAKDRPGGRHTLDGAKADKTAWMSWANAKRK